MNPEMKSSHKGASSDGPSVSWFPAAIWREAWLVDLGGGKNHHTDTSLGIHS